MVSTSVDGDSLTFFFFFFFSYIYIYIHTWFFLYRKQNQSLTQIGYLGLQHDNDDEGKVVMKKMMK
jgi:hypothetical protein